jgi:hypothetical protein
VSLPVLSALRTNGVTFEGLFANIDNTFSVEVLLVDSETY